MEELKKTINEAKAYLKKSKEEERDKFFLSTSFYETDEYIYEQGYDKKSNKVYFIRWSIAEETFDKVTEFEDCGIKYKPISGEELNKGVVLLPEEPLEYTSDEELDQEIVDHIHKWLDVPENFERFACYNIKLSWVFQKFNTLNYTRALGDTGTGKSRFLFTLGHIHYKPMIVAGALTPAVIFRIINKWKGTLLIDEGDQDKSDESNTFIKIINCGYEKGMAISRCDKNDPNKLDFFEVFCPKVITTRKRFEDKATEARCMTSIMVQTFRKEIPDILTKEYFETSRTLRNKLLMWRFKNYSKIDPDAGLAVDMNKYEPRLRQVNRAFVSLFADKPEQLSNFMLHLDKYQENIIEERADSFDGVLINVLARLIVQGNEYVSPQNIVDFANESGINFQYELHSRVVGKHFKSLGLEFKRRKVDGRTKNCLILEKTILENTFSRYVVDQEINEKLVTLGYDVTSVTSVMVTCGKNEKLAKNGNVENDSCPRISRNSRNHVTNNNIKKGDVKFHLDTFTSDGTMAIEQLKDDLNLTDEFIDTLLKNGDFFQPRAGWIKAT